MKPGLVDRTYHPAMLVSQMLGNATGQCLQNVSHIKCTCVIACQQTDVITAICWISQYKTDWGAGNTI